MSYKARFGLRFDTSELEQYIKNLERAVKNEDGVTKIKKAIHPTLILRKASVVALEELVKATPSGDDYTNWGGWQYNGYFLYGGTHSKNTLKRGWVVTQPSMAERKRYWLPTTFEINEFADANVFVKSSKVGRVQHVILENCVEYGMAVEYGHRVVLPGERGEVSARGGSRATRNPTKTKSVGRWVPGQYFVARTFKDTTKLVSETIQKEYLKQLREVLRRV